ncbi:MAG: NAD-dependent epimerase/dehydratase family protein [Clostridia bacterium]|nr:NAD-dependent epimerase/dehydratase family protein [Clostridia bacterium]
MGKCGRYVFISTATVYQKPPRSLLVTTDTPHDNPYWDYSQKKIECEKVLRRMEKEQGLPLCIIRPSWTYGDRDVPFILRPKNGGWALVSRMRAGKPVLIPGDGNIFWTITHAADLAHALVALMDLPETLGEDFHLTQDEYMTWNDFARVIADAAGAPAPKLVHVATDRLIESDPSLIGPLLGDKAQPTVFDNSKVRRFLPDFRFEIPFARGIVRSIAVLDSDPELHIPCKEWNDWVDEMIEKHG